MSIDCDKGCDECPINGDNKEVSKEVMHTQGLCITFTEEEMEAMGVNKLHRGCR